jgi:hypothetical protein
LRDNFLHFTCEEVPLAPGGGRQKARSGPSPTRPKRREVFLGLSEIGKLMEVLVGLRKGE